MNVMEKSCLVGVPVEPAVEEPYSSPGFVAYVGHMGDPRLYATLDETRVKGVFSIARDGRGSFPGQDHVAALGRWHI